MHKTTVTTKKNAHTDANSFTVFIEPTRRLMLRTWKQSENNKNSRGVGECVGLATCDLLRNTCFKPPIQSAYDRDRKVSQTGGETQRQRTVPWNIHAAHRQNPKRKMWWKKTSTMWFTAEVMSHPDADSLSKTSQWRRSKPDVQAESNV